MEYPWLIAPKPIGRWYNLTIDRLTFHGRNFSVMDMTACAMYVVFSVLHVVMVLSGFIIIPYKGLFSVYGTQYLSKQNTKDPENQVEHITTCYRHNCIFLFLSAVWYVHLFKHRFIFFF